ncbi:hypothetical protein R1sor_006504 [Riccia sorocarpa]|uniref:Reverse transcriptase zinc-binding domain-containing protein n=1 Tax=Riccia sorocarpa TaxID=122646 RepID=A0ABD3HML2_9MARC
MQVWTDFINDLQERQILRGVFLPQANITYIQGHFANDTHLMLAADQRNLQEAKTAIALFGQASGLQVQWNKSLVTWISTAPRPSWTDHLDWKWTQEGEEHRMLGFIFTQALDQEAIFHKCLGKIDNVLNEKKLSSKSLQGRITIANHIIYGYIWFLLPLWAGNDKQLEAIDKKIVRFVWGGANTSPRQRIAHKVLQLPKSTSGLGLLAAKHQASAFAAATITWGRSNSLKEAGITPLKHIADSRGRILEPHQINSIRNLDRRVMAAYQKIKTNTADCQAPPRVSRATLTYYTTTGAAAGYCLAVRSKATLLTSEEIDATNLQTTYKVTEGGLLKPHDPMELLQGASWTAATIIPTARGQKGNRRLVLTHDYMLEASMTKMQWNNSNDFYYFKNSHIRSSLTQDPEAAVKRINKWKLIIPFKEKDPRRWTKTWNSKRTARQASFLSLVIYSAIATNRWRFPAAPRADPSTWCTRCDSNRAEDVTHLLWTCPSSKLIWEWAFSILHRAFPALHGWKPRLAHALIAEPLPSKFKYAAVWWEACRGQILWTIWKTRNEHAFQRDPFSIPKVIEVIWAEMRNLTEQRWIDHKRSQKSRTANNS